MLICEQAKLACTRAGALASERKRLAIHTDLRASRADVHSQLLGLQASFGDMQAVCADLRSSRADLYSELLCLQANFSDLHATRTDLQSELLVCKPAGATWSLCKLACQPRWLAKPAEPSSQ